MPIGSYRNPAGVAYQRLDREQIKTEYKRLSSLAQIGTDVDAEIKALDVHAYRLGLAYDCTADKYIDMQAETK